MQRYYLLFIWPYGIMVVYGGNFILYIKTLYRFAMRQRLGLILEIKSLYNKGCISTKEANLIIFDLHFISNLRCCT